MNNGIIYAVMDEAIKYINKLNLVELLKFIAKFLSKRKSTELENINIAIDLFIVIKFFIILYFWYNGINNLFCIVITSYLIFTNLHTYFYYHVWSERAITNEQVSIQRMRRRFINIIIAIIFSIICYAYLYHVCYANQFAGWPKDLNSWLVALSFSLTNSIKGSGYLIPLTNMALILTVSQFLSSYVFLAIMLSRSTPQYTGKK